MNNKIYLSYSYNDKSWANQFMIALENQGIEIRLPNLTSGEYAKETIRFALRKSSVLVVLLSSNSVNNNWIFFEFGAAVADNKRIISIVIDDLKQEQLPIPMMKYLCLHESSPTSAAEEVTRFIQN